MLISRLALSLFWFPGVCPLRLEYFVFLKRITGSFSCFRCLIFKVLCAPFSSVKRLTILPHLLMFVNNFFRSFFWRAFQFYHTVSGLSRTFFALPVRNFSILPQPLKVCQDFFPLRLALDYNTTLSSSCQRFFSLFFAFFHGLVHLYGIFPVFSTLQVKMPCLLRRQGISKPNLNPNARCRSYLSADRLRKNHNPAPFSFFTFPPRAPLQRHDCGSPDAAHSIPHYGFLLLHTAKGRYQ